MSTYDVVMMPIDDVKPYERNPRKNAGAVAKVAASIKAFGFRQPVVVDPANVVVVGHTRLMAAKELGLERVPVHVAHGLSEAQLRAYRLADNRTNEEADWDDQLLPGEFKGIELEGLDLELTGFDRIEWMKALDRLGEKIDPATEWQGMPEFVQEDEMPHRTIFVHFASDEAAEAFARLIGQSITEHTKYVWYPKQERERHTERGYESAA